MTSDLRRRVKACFLMAAVNFFSILLPQTQRLSFFGLISLGLTLNLLVCWLILKKVKSSGEEREHLQVVALAKKWTLLLGGLATLAALIFAAAGSLHKQAILFLACGYLFFLVPGRVLDLSIKKRMEELNETRRAR